VTVSAFPIRRVLVGRIPVTARRPAFRTECSAPAPQAAGAPFARVGPAVARMRRRLLQRQRPDGSWCERPAGDPAATADVLLLLAFAGRRDDPRRDGLVRGLLDAHRPDGS